MDFRMQTPIRMIIAAPSQSGKSYFVKKLLEEQKYCLSEQFKEVIWCYGIEQKRFFEELRANIPNIKLREGFPEQKINENKFIPNDGKSRCLVIDDLVCECSNSSALIKLFTKISHHRNLSVILLIQALFWPGDAIRIAQRNATHLILFASPRDAQSVRTMVRELSSLNSAKLRHQFRVIFCRQNKYLSVTATSWCQHILKQLRSQGVIY